MRDWGADLVLVDGENLGARAAAELGGDRLRLLLDGIGGTGPARWPARSRTAAPLWRSQADSATVR
jgi:hypothetical protein